jgi:hypothetical protein
VLRNLPYDVYLPAGMFDVSPITIREYFSGTRDAIVQGTIRRVVSPIGGDRAEATEPRFATADIYEMEDLGEVPERCPGYYLEVEYPERQPFSTACELVGHAKNGAPIYRSKPELIPSDQRYSMVVKSSSKRTLIVIRLPDDLDEAQIAGFLTAFDNLQPVYQDKLVEMYDRYRADRR